MADAGNPFGDAPAAEPEPASPGNPFGDAAEAPKAEGGNPFGDAPTEAPKAEEGGNPFGDAEAPKAEEGGNPFGDAPAAPADAAVDAAADELAAASVEPAAAEDEVDEDRMGGFGETPTYGVGTNAPSQQFAEAPAGAEGSNKGGIFSGPILKKSEWKKVWHQRVMRVVPAHLNAKAQLVWFSPDNLSGEAKRKTFTLDDSASVVVKGDQLICKNKVGLIGTELFFMAAPGTGDGRVPTLKDWENHILSMLPATAARANMAAQLHGRASGRAN